MGTWFSGGFGVAVLTGELSYPERSFPTSATPGFSESLWYSESVVQIACTMQHRRAGRAACWKLSQVAELPQVPGDQWVWAGQVKETKLAVVRNCLRLFPAAPCRSLNGKARRYFRCCNSVNTSSRLRKTWNNRPVGNTATLLWLNWCLVHHPHQEKPDFSC